MTSPTRRNKRRKTNTIPVNSVVAINTEDILADRLHELELLPFMICPKIYGVVKHVLPFHGEGHNEYIVKWGLRGFLNMDEEEVAEYNETLFGANDLTIVKRPNDIYDPNDMYLHLLFDKNADETGWQVRTFAPYDCDSCD